MRHFPYIKQNSIAEIVSTMESFLYRAAKKDISRIFEKSAYGKDFL